MLLDDLKRLYSNAYRGHMSTFTYQYVHVYLSICPRLPINMSTFTLRIYTHLNSMDISNEIIMCTYEQISSERQCLMNASYNLDLVEQRLILLAIIEARESGKGINANDPLTVHAESYINQFGVHRVTAYQALKDACDNLFARQFSYQSKVKKGTYKIIVHVGLVKLFTLIQKQQ